MSNGQFHNCLDCYFLQILVSVIPLEPWEFPHWEKNTPFLGQTAVGFVKQDVTFGQLTDHSTVSLRSTIVKPFRTAFNSVKKLVSTRARCKTSKCQSVTQGRCNECKKAYCDNHSTKICHVCYENGANWKCSCTLLEKLCFSIVSPIFLDILCVIVDFVQIFKSW